MDSLKWVPAGSPLQAVGLIVPNDAKGLQHLLDLDSERVARLRGSYSSNTVLLLAEEDDLPWIPNATYLGQMESASNILIPTHMRPNFPIDWLARAIRLRFGEGRYAIDPVRHQVFNVTKALNISVSKLRSLHDKLHGGRANETA